MHISSEHFLKLFVVLFFWTFQMLGMVLTLGGEWIFRQIGKNPPHFVQRMGENKYYAMGAFFILRSMANQLVNTGAFEVYIDGDLVRAIFMYIYYLRSYVMT